MGGSTYEVSNIAWTFVVPTSLHNPLPVGSGHIGIRSLTLMVLALFAVRTVLHWRAERIRDEQDEGISS